MDILKSILLKYYKLNDVQFTSKLKEYNIKVLASTTNHTTGIIKHNRTQYHFIIKQFKFNYNTMILERLDNPIIVLERV